MKTTTTTLLFCLALFTAACITLITSQLTAAEEGSAARFEYVTLRWAGPNHTHVIRPNGNAEFLTSQLSGRKRPNRSNDRSFYMNVALNSLAKEGYELVSMTSDDYILKRQVAN